MAVQAGSGDMGETQFLWGMLLKAIREEENTLVSPFFSPPLTDISAYHQPNPARKQLMEKLGKHRLQG